MKLKLCCWPVRARCLTAPDQPPCLRASDGHAAPGQPFPEVPRSRRTDAWRPATPDGRILKGDRCRCLDSERKPLLKIRYQKTNGEDKPGERTTNAGEVQFRTSSSCSSAVA